MIPRCSVSLWEASNYIVDTAHHPTDIDVCEPVLGRQGNVDALLQLGDSHWYGRGAERNWARAAVLYQTASKFRNSQALFNLGFMHEFGAGLPQVTPSQHLFREQL